MPPKMLKSLAKKAGVAFKKAEEYWNAAKKSWEKQKKDVKDKWSYITGIVKKRLGLASEDMVSAGFPINLVVEAEVLAEGVDVESEEKLDETEAVFALFGLRKLYEVEKYERKSQLVKVEDGEAKMNLAIFEGATDAKTLEYFRKIFPNVPEQYFSFLAAQARK